MSIDIAKSRKICDAATKGPWLEAAVCRQLRFYGKSWMGEGWEEEWPDDHNEPDHYGGDAAFIAHARTALPAALDEIERLRSELDRYVESMT